MGPCRAADTHVDCVHCQRSDHSRGDSKRYSNIMLASFIMFVVYESTPRLIVNDDITERADCGVSFHLQLIALCICQPERTCGTPSLQRDSHGNRRARYLSLDRCAPLT